MNGRRHGKRYIYFRSGRIMYDINYVHGDTAEVKLYAEKVIHDYTTYFFKSNQPEMKRKLEVGDFFCCESRYYRVSRGNMKYSYFGTKKSNNFLVTRMKWKLDNSVVVPDDDKTKNFHHMDIYKLVEDGKPHKFLTINTNYEISFFIEGTLYVDYKTEKERAEKLSKIENMLTI